MGKIPEPHEFANLVEAHLHGFHARYGPRDARVFFSPGRVNLMGAHLDYNGGPVMPLAVHAGTIVASRPRGDRRLRLASTLDGEERTFRLDDLPSAPLSSWVDYPLGVVRFVLERTGSEACGLDLLFGGNLPIGAGLSSSASICVGTAHMLDAVWGTGLSVQERVDAALAAERGFVGVNCGIMDPYAVGFARPGHILWLDCKDASFEHLPLDPTRVVVAVADTGVRRQLAQGEFNRRVEECRLAFEALAGYANGARCLRDVPLSVLDAHGARLDPVLEKRARHVLEEVERTFTARRALLEGDLHTFGKQMSAAHRSLSDLFDVSVPELDCLVETALEWNGVLGARLTGAGFGGCAVILLAVDARPGLEEWVSTRFEERFGRAPGISFFEGDPGPRELL